MANGTRVTIEDIGKKLDLSASTVSRALRQDPLIHPQTRAEVNALAMKMGYQGRSRRGPSLGKKTASVAVLFSTASFAQIRSGFITTAYLEGLTSGAEAAGMALSIHTSGQDTVTGVPTKELPRSLHTAKFDATIVVGQHDAAIVDALQKRAPVVSLVRKYPNDVDIVSTDDIHGMGLIVHHLAELGHRRLACAGSGGPPLIRGSHQQSRQAGFICGCIDSGLDPTEQVIFGPDFFSGMAVADPKVLLKALENGVTGIVCTSDGMAEVVMHELGNLGIKVPAHVSVTGFDGVLQTMNAEPLITTVNPHFVEMGRSAVRLAMWRLEQPSARPVTLTLEGDLIIGPSTAKARKG